MEVVRSAALPLALTNALRFGNLLNGAGKAKRSSTQATLFQHARSAAAALSGCQDALARTFLVLLGSHCRS